MKSVPRGLSFDLAALQGFQGCWPSFAHNSLILDGNKIMDDGNSFSAYTFASGRRLCFQPLIIRISKNELFEWIVVINNSRSIVKAIFTYCRRGSKSSPQDSSCQAPFVFEGFARDWGNCIPEDLYITSPAPASTISSDSRHKYPWTW